MALGDFVALICDSDKVRVIHDGRDVFVGWLALLKIHKELFAKLREDEVKGFRAVPEIRHKRWEELGLMGPLEPYVPSEYSFSDMQMDLYYTIYI